MTRKRERPRPFVDPCSKRQYDDARGRTHFVLALFTPVRRTSAPEKCPSQTCLKPQTTFKGQLLGVGPNPKEVKPVMSCIRCLAVQQNVRVTYALFKSA